MNYQQRKAIRIEKNNSKKGLIASDCLSCNGTGYYDNLDYLGRNMYCGSCDGTGKEYRKAQGRTLKDMLGKTLIIKLSDDTERYMRIYVRSKSLVLYAIITKDSEGNYKRNEGEQHRAKIEISCGTVYLRPLVHHHLYKLDNYEILG